jgi:DNA adenine methylase
MPTSNPALGGAPSLGAAPASPFVKWAGGKSRLLTQLMPLLPPGAERMRHVEPFVGGGAMFFARRPARALLADVNPLLVATYEAVRDRVGDVIEELRRLAQKHAPDAYYRVRDRFNLARGHGPERAAMFLYLNKTCFNGLYRVNRDGAFNVPAGRYSNPRILDPATLLAASHVLRSAEIRCAAFDTLLRSAKPGDFVYLDPPYEPASPTASFTAYARDGFSREDQVRLRDVWVALDRRGCALMLSNSDVPFTRELYRGFRVDRVAAPRAINRDASKRGPVSEIVVRNYA